VTSAARLQEIRMAHGPARETDFPLSKLLSMGRDCNIRRIATACDGLLFRHDGYFYAVFFYETHNPLIIKNI
jgi:hypothetical protein